MRQLKKILGLTILVVIISCSKDKSKTDEGNWCGTDETWTQTLTKDNLVGNWTIWSIYYSKGTDNTVLFDTTYSVTAPLTLNANGTGTIYNKTLNWSLTTSPGSFPKLTITQLDTLFSFPVGFIHNDTTDIYLQLPPASSFYGRASKNGTSWESSDITFWHQ